MTLPIEASPRRMQLDALGMSLLIACCILWALQQIAVKAVLASLAPLLQGAIRSTGAALLLWGWSLWRGTPLFKRDRTLAAGLVAGLLFGLEFASIYLALPRTNASRVIVFIYMAPFVVAIVLPRFVATERLNRMQAFGLAGAFIALAYAFSEGFSGGAHTQLLGDALALVAAVLWGLTTVVVRASQLASASAEKTLFYQLAVSAAVLFAFSLALHEPWPTQALPALAIESLVFQTVIVAFISYLIWFWLLRNYSATKISAFTFLTPLFGLIFSSLLLQEAVGHRIVVALIFVALGIYLVNRPQQPAH